MSAVTHASPRARSAWSGRAAAGVLALACGWSVSLPGQAQTQTRPDLHGVWWAASVQPALVPVGGAAIPFTKDGKKLYDEAAAAFKAAAAKPVGRNDLGHCVPFGPTRVLGQNFPMQIVQTGNTFVLIWEHNHSYEEVYVGQQPDLQRDEAYMGNSVGAWTPDGMAISTTNVKEGTYLDDTGLPHSDKLSLRRVLRKIDGGKQLEIVTTITDPVMYSKPWTVRHVLQARPDARIEEYTCGQGPTLETRYTR